MSSAQNILSTLRRFPIATACGALTLLAAGAFAYRFSELDDRQQELTRIRGEADTLRRNVQNATDLEVHLKRLTDGLSKLDARLVKETELATNLERFYRLEAETGVKMTVQQASSASRKTQPKQGLVPIGFAVGVESSFTNLLNFVVAVERAPFEYRVISFSVLPSSGGREGGEGATGERVTLNMQLELLGTP